MEHINMKLNGTGYYSIARKYEKYRCSAFIIQGRLKVGPISRRPMVKLL